MSIVEQAPSYVRAISPYIPGKPITELARQMGIPVEKIVKLASNENPLGMSPKARAAVEAALSGIERYPDQFDLIAAIAERHGVAQEQVVLGNGSNDVLDLAPRVFLAPGRSAVFSRHAFAVYPLASMSARRRVHCRAGEELRPRPGAMLAAIRPDTRWSSSPTRTTRPATSCRRPKVRAFIAKMPAPRLRGARRGLYRIPGAGRPCRHGGLDQGLPQPAGGAHLLQDLRPGGLARRLRHRPQPR
jgi:histidinol-phosphate aminotransferase